MRKAALLGISIAVFALSFGMGEYNEPLHKQYKIKPGSALAKANCGVCHVGEHGGKLNPYGLDLQKVMKKENTKVLTVAHLLKVEKLDSDKDGKSNKKELTTDKNPGVK